MGDIETASFRSGSDGGTVHKIVRRLSLRPSGSSAPRKRKARLSGAFSRSRRADSNRGPLHYE